MELKSVIFENGVELNKNKTGKWELKSHPQKDKKINISPLEIIQTIKLRIVLLQHKINPVDNLYSLLPYTKNFEQNEILDFKYSDFITGNPINSNIALMYHCHNLGYTVGSTMYHCKQLAKIYSDICNQFTRHFIYDLNNNKSLFGHQPEAYYEFDALISAARRSYDISRFLLGNLFSTKKKNIPRNFLKTLSVCDKIPDKLYKRLNKSWSIFGEKLKLYRDCIHHYSSIDFSLSSAFMKKLNDKIWSVSILIPDNPEVRSKKKLEFKKNIDALTYGWKITTEIVEVMHAILNYGLRTFHPTIKCTPFISTELRPFPDEE